MWNYWLGGKDNFAADREAAQRVLQVMPSVPLIARAARLFLIDAVQPRAGGPVLRRPGHGASRAGAVTRGSDLDGYPRNHAA
jgi:S-adenosyl methyltransferase